MKFKCSKTYEEEQLLKKQKLDATIEKWKGGIRRFAWFPKELTQGTCIWLESYTEERKYTEAFVFAGAEIKYTLSDNTVVIA